MSRAVRLLRRKRTENDQGAAVLGLLKLLGEEPAACHLVHQPRLGCTGHGRDAGWKRLGKREVQWLGQQGGHLLALEQDGHVKRRARRRILGGDLLSWLACAVCPGGRMATTLLTPPM
jgi:hypothetical protein